jgi:uncharacterized protein
MRDFGGAIGLVFAIEGLLMAGFTDQMRKRMAAAAQEEPAKLRAVGLAPRWSGSELSGPRGPCFKGAVPFAPKSP